MMLEKNISVRGLKMRSKLNYNMLHPTYKALYDIVGEEDLIKIYNLFRGTQLQLPMKMYDRVALKKAIREGQLNGMTNQEISLEFGYSPRWIKSVREGKDKNLN